MIGENKCTCADGAGYLICPIHPPIAGITVTKFDVLLRCLPKSPYRDRFTAEIVAMEDQLKSVTDERDELILRNAQLATSNGQLRHDICILESRIKASQKQEPALFVSSQQVPASLTPNGQSPHYVPYRITSEGLFDKPLFDNPVIQPTQAELQTEIERLKLLSVTRILLRIEPGDGDGEEIYAKSVTEVENIIGALGGELEDWELGIKLHPDLTRKLAEQQALTTTAERLLKTWLNSIDGLVSAYNTKIKVEEFIRRDSDSEELNKLLAEASAQAVANMSGEQEFVVKRARRIAKLLNLESAMPDDKTIYGCIGTVLGNFARVIEDRSEGGKFQEDSARLDYLIRTENFVWEVNRRYSIHQATEHSGISDSDYMSARDAIDSLMLSAAPKPTDEKSCQVGNSGQK